MRSISGESSPSRQAAIPKNSSIHVTLYNGLKSISKLVGGWEKDKDPAVTSHISHVTIMNL